MELRCLVTEIIFYHRQVADILIGYVRTVQLVLVKEYMMQNSDVIWLFREHQKPTNIDRRKEISAAFVVAIHPLVRSRHYVESEVAVRQILTRSLGAPPSVVALCESALIQICRGYADAYTEEADRLLLEQICGGTYFPASG